jgi:hypothetical protein
MCAISSDGTCSPSSSAKASTTDTLGSVLSTGKITTTAANGKTTVMQTVAPMSYFTAHGVASGGAVIAGGNGGAATITAGPTDAPSSASTG